MNRKYCCAPQDLDRSMKKKANVRAKTYLLEQTRKVKPNWLNKYRIKLQNALKNSTQKMKKFETEIIKLSIPPTSVFQSEKV